MSSVTNSKSIEKRPNTEVQNSSQTKKTKIEQVVDNNNSINTASSNTPSQLDGARFLKIGQTTFSLKSEEVAKLINKSEFFKAGFEKSNVIIQKHNITNYNEHMIKRLIALSLKDASPLCADSFDQTILYYDFAKQLGLEEIRKDLQEQLMQQLTFENFRFVAERVADNPSYCEELCQKVISSNLFRNGFFLEDLFLSETGKVMLNFLKTHGSAVKSCKFRYFYNKKSFTNFGTLCKLCPNLEKIGFVGAHSGNDNDVAVEERALFYKSCSSLSNLKTIGVKDFKISFSSKVDEKLNLPMGTSFNSLLANGVTKDQLLLALAHESEEKQLKDSELKMDVAQSKLSVDFERLKKLNEPKEEYYPEIASVLVHSNLFMDALFVDPIFLSERANELINFLKNNGKFLKSSEFIFYYDDESRSHFYNLYKYCPNITELSLSGLIYKVCEDPKMNERDLIYRTLSNFSKLEKIKLKNFKFISTVQEKLDPNGDYYIKKFEEGVSPDELLNILEYTPWDT